MLSHDEKVDVVRDAVAALLAEVDPEQFENDDLAHTIVRALELTEAANSTRKNLTCTREGQTQVPKRFQNSATRILPPADRSRP
ncbi:hypothetical protein ACGFNX_33810 [Streptomyces sp. NPDC048723]|uniref:hypothetical protein n=1 Tax=Streptomyces sp. NPDC048723 TaxID=3365589 RepID=UPI003723E922